MRSWLLAAAVLGGGLAVRAEEPASPPPPPPAPTFAETVVVTATLEPAAEEELPASVTVVQRAEIAARQAVDLPDVLATVPGLALVQAGPPGQQTSVFLRGADSEQTLLLWNGIPLNDPFFGGANWQFVPLDGAERVEIVRGPFSALYGSQAVGGVVQVVSGAEPGVALRLEGGDDGYRRAGVAAAHEAGRLRLDLAGSLRRGGGPLPNDDYDGEDLLARARWTLRPGVSAGVLARVGDAETGIPLSEGRATPRRAIAWRERELALPVSVERGAWGVEAQLAQARFDSAFRDPDDPFGFTAADTGAEALRGRAVATWRPPRRAGSWLAFGAEGERLEVDNRSVFGTNLAGARQETWALFAQASHGLGPLRLDVGARRDENDVYGGATSLRAGALWALAGGVRLRASYGESFRAPSLGELFFPGSGNPDLQPEVGESAELGVEWRRGPFRAALTGFETRQRDLIDFDFVAFRNVNLGRARSRGVEAEVGWERGIAAVRAHATWLNAEDRVR
ncbi:MAG TPA: TonB-dependent receptor, partial [Thermoanaerobaculia bacterium]|nr:TonB-dependent receptor [Thermoanaerobaculia bacterium]